ncbi:MAG: helix-turn-helix domain-containing protein [Oscillospiraceae bacterium]|nr:helix-turn-helix domain-containing protein [Oscillospiraceae bacterium]
MREINNAEETLTFCRAISSPARLFIVRYLMQNRSANLNELAEALGVTNGAVTAHIKALQAAKIIDTVNTSGRRGIQKNCRLREHRFLINLHNEYGADSMYQTEIPVGSYSRHEAYPTCGLASVNAVIGEVDDKRYFDDPKRAKAGIVWLSNGFLEYRVPNYLKEGARAKEIQLSFEIASEAPGVCEDWPSDIYFYLNDVPLGFWTSPGDFGAERGLYTPDWWFPNWNQYGLLKLLTINGEGTYIDGLKVSDERLLKLNIDHESPIVFRIEAPADAENKGGLTLFGKGFGNYNQDIHVRVIFEAPGA